MDETRTLIAFNPSELALVEYYEANKTTYKPGAYSRIQAARKKLEGKMIDDIKAALADYDNGFPRKIEIGAPKWLAALLEYYEAAEAWRGATYETPDSWARWVAARKKLEDK